MGGFGSGRKSGKRTTIDMLALDIRRLHREGLLVLGHSFTRQWSRNGQPIARIGITVEEHNLMLSYRARRGGDEWEDKQYPIPLTRAACHFGGQRAWFLCPCCGRRVAVLYGGRIFACRGCNSLVYRSQREDEPYRALRRAQKIQDRLGWKGPNDWEKPRGMHWQTFWRLEQVHAHFDRRALLAAAEKFNPKGTATTRELAGFSVFETV